MGGSPASAFESAAQLLRIDFHAALDKLAWSQLQGSWQLPAELARLGIATGASSVELDIAPRRLALIARGSRLERRTISDFASLLDRDLAAAERHRALVALEERGAFVLAAIAGSEVRSLALETGGGDGVRLELRAGGELGVVNPVDSALRRPDLELRIDGLAIEAERASRWLRRVGRFAAVPIALNGRRIDRGFDAPLVSGRLRAARKGSGPGAGRASPAASLPTAVAIPRHGSAPRLWLLRNGIIATRATVPGYPAFEAVVEMAPVAGTRATEASLRDRLGPYVDSIIDAAVGLTIRLARSIGARTADARTADARTADARTGDARTADARTADARTADAQSAETRTLGGSPDEIRERTARLLLEAARKRRRLAEVSGVEIFPMVGPRGRRWVSIDEIARCVRVEAGGVCALDAIPPGEDPAEFALAGRGALVVSQAERALLSEHLHAVFSTPPARLRQPLGRRLWAAVAGRLPALGPRGRVVSESELSTAERAFLARVRAAVDASPAIAFRTGGGRVRRAGDGTLVLPRSNPDVRASVAVVARDPAWLYPALLGLADRRRPVEPGPEARRVWLTSLTLRSHPAPSTSPSPRT